MTLGMIVALVFLVLGVIVAFGAIKIVPQGREFTVERFGRYTRTLKPGISFLTPFVEGVGRRVSMMEQVPRARQEGSPRQRRVRSTPSSSSR